MALITFKMTISVFIVLRLCGKGISTEELTLSSVSSDMSLDYDLTDPEETFSESETTLSDSTVRLKTISEEEQANEDSDHTLRGQVVPVNTELDEILVGLEHIAVNNSVHNSSNNTVVSEEKGNVTSIVACNTGKEIEGQQVELVNSTRLINILITESNVTDRRTSAECTLVLFYARYCPFSSMAAPHFNALPRAFPDIKLAAVDAMKHHSFNTQYGIVGVPTLMLFHNGRPAAKFNDSEYNLESFAKFITKYTGLEPHEKLYVTSADFGGPVSSVPTKETDYCLILSWAFMFVCGLYFFSKSSWWRWISEAVQNTWREAEAQHEHGD